MPRSVIVDMFPCLEPLMARKAGETAQEYGKTSLLDTGLASLRLGSALLIWTFHVVPKLGHFEEELQTFPNLLGLGSSVNFLIALVVEGICSLLVAVGLATRLAAFSLVGVMATVMLMAALNFPHADGQSAALYGLLYFIVLQTGAGRLSLDSFLSRA